MLMHYAAQGFEVWSAECEILILDYLLLSRDSSVSIVSKQQDGR
jgi:hypothetical protein